MIISLSHNDMDGVGAQIVLNKTYPDITTLNTSYGKVSEYIEIISDMLISRTNIDEVYITDLNITELEMVTLYNLSKQYPHIIFNYIDHHDYDYEPQKYKRNNLHIAVSKKFCSTKLTYGFCKAHKNLKPDKDLTYFVNVIDAYDLWQTENLLFQEGLRLNELFWSLMVRNFYLRFKDITKLRMVDNEKIDAMFIKKNKIFTKLKESGRLFTAENKSVLLCFLDVFRSHITLDFPGYWCYVNVTLYGNVSIRLSTSFTELEAIHMKNTLVDFSMSLPSVVSAGGHIHAMGITSTLKGDSEGLINLGRVLSVKADEIMEKELKLYNGQGPFIR